MIHSNKLTEAFDLLTTEVRNNFTKREGEMPTNGELFKVALNAYNAYNDNERGGVDRIFDIREKDDLMAMVKGGMTAADIAAMVSTGFWYFYFGENHDKPEPLSFKDVILQVRGFARQITACAILFNSRCNEYGAWLDTFLTDMVTADEPLYDQLINC